MEVKGPSFFGSDVLIGKTLFERYRIERKAGQGGMAWVFKAIDLETQEPVALKILKPTIAEDPNICKRFLREAEIQSVLEHPNVVGVQGAGEFKELIVMVLEWVEGETLDDLLERHPEPLGLEDICALMLPVFEAVGHAHNKNLVHRDLKPENILLKWKASQPIPKVTDFGVAKVLDEMDQQTKTGTIMGTLSYMSPEQIESTKSVDHRADTYSLGVCIFRMATGRLPFEGPMQKVMLHAVYKDPPEPDSLNDNISHAFSQLILKSMAKKPEDRFQTCAEFAEELDELCQMQDAMTMDFSEDGDITLPEKTLSFSPPEANILLEKDMSEDSFSETVMVEESDESLGSSASFIDFRGTPGEGFAPGSSEQSLPSGAFAQIEYTDEDDTEVEGELHRHVPDTQKKGVPTKPILIGVVALLLLVGGYLFLGGGGKGDKKAIPTGHSDTCKVGEKRSCFSGAKQAIGKGACRAGVQICKEGRFGPCVGEILPKKVDECNGKDDDCDGQVDEDFPKKGSACTLTKGACVFSGVWKCDAKEKQLSCQSDAKQLQSKKHKPVTFRLSPSKKAFKVTIGANTYKASGNYCVPLPLSKRIRLKIRARGFYTCRLRLSTKGAKSVLLKMRKKSKFQLEPRARYCLRKVKK